MHAGSTSCCWPVEIAVDYSYVLAIKASPNVEMARLVALRYGGESSRRQSRAWVTVQAPFIACSVV